MQKIQPDSLTFSSWRDLLDTLAADPFETKKVLRKNRKK